MLSCFFLGALSPTAEPAGAQCRAVLLEIAVEAVDSDGDSNIVLVEAV